MPSPPRRRRGSIEIAAAALGVALVGCRGAPKAGALAADAPPEATAAAARGARIGERAPRFTAPDLLGRTTSLEDGRVHLVAFLATWSSPDKKSIRPLEQISRRFREEGLSVVAVSIDDEDSRSLVPEFFRQYGGTFPVVWDEGHRIANLFRIATDPTFVLVDRRGVVRFVHHGYHGDEHLEMEREAATLLGER